MNKIMWYLWQLLPFEYQTVFLDTSNGNYYHSVWRMWFGRCFWIRENQIGLTVDPTSEDILRDIVALFDVPDGIDIDIVERIKALVGK